MNILAVWLSVLPQVQAGAAALILITITLLVDFNSCAD